MTAKKLTFIVFLFGFLHLSAYATDDRRERDRELHDPAPSATRSSDPETAYLRTEQVFSHLGIPDEPDHSTLLDPLRDRVSASGLLKMIGQLDFKPGESGRFWRLQARADGSTDWVFYRDRDSKRHEDFRIHLASENTAAPSVPKFKMQGLRIAIDPGHMGSPEWDQLTGKFVRDGHGNRLSEGLLVLELAYLVRERLERAGAVVTLTRELPAPASLTEYGKFDPRDSIEEEIHESALQSWLLKLVDRLAPGPGLWSAVANAPKYHAIQDYPRSQYFIDGPDLEGRVTKIREAHADLAVILHLDTNSPAHHPNGLGTPKSGVKAYVPGSFLPSEYATRETRAYFAANALHPETWNESVRLGRSIVGAIHSRLGVALDSADASDTKEVAPGILARNLDVQKHIPGIVSSFVECLYYSDPTEFRKLSDYSFSMRIGEKTYPYSQRLVDLADAVTAGITQYVE